MSTRILHCSTSIENYNICIEQKVAGFSNRGPQPGDLIYLAAKVGKKTLCTARFILDKPTDLRPWSDGERYVHTLRIRDIQYCDPFDLNILSHAGGKFWGIKYMQGSKPITDNKACDVLNHTFTNNQINRFIPFDLPSREVKIPNAVVQKELIGKLVIPDEEAPLTRDSIRIQGMLSEIGDRMGYSIWLPRNDRSRVLEVWQPKKSAVLNDLPLNYDLDTIRTIENIDVLWIKGRTIVRAFEIEHTTSIYSGILRMADLMALQPNLNIKAHIVAPEERRGKVMQELSRPVFRLVLAHSCSFISYVSVEELAKEKRLEFMTDAVIEDISESAKEATAF
jgi:hypothetical protein